MTPGRDDPVERFPVAERRGPEALLPPLGGAHCPSKELAVALLPITALFVVVVAIIVFSMSVPFSDRLPRVSVRRITMPIQSVAE